MSDKPTAANLELEQRIRGHQANYAIFQARNENEISQAMLGAFQASPFACAYYAANETGLGRALFLDTGRHPSIREIPEQVEISPAETARYFAREFSVAAVPGAELPAAFKSSLIEAGYSHVGIIPILQDVVVRGLLLALARPGQPITAEAIEPLVRLAESIPNALEAIKAGRTTKKRLRELEGITETSQVISSSNDLGLLYEILHKQINATIGTDVDFSVAIYEPKNGTIELAYVMEAGKRVNYDPYPMGEGLISILIRTHQPMMLVEDTERRARALGAKIIGAPPRSWLGCPFVVGGEAIGAMVVQDGAREQRFSQDDLRFMIALSAQVAGAIYNIRLLEDARRRALQLETVAEISREVSSSLIVDSLLRQAVSLVRERFTFYHAAVFLVDSLGEYAIIREATGEAGAQMKRAGHRLGVGSKSIVGRTTQSREALVVNDVNKDSGYYANPLLPETRAEACLPLKVGGRVLGVLDVQSTHAYAFTSENVKILQILADQLAVAVVNSELFAEAQERLSQHRLLHHVTTAAASSTTIEEALNSAVQGLQVTLGGDQIAILLADKEQKTLEVRSAIGYPNDESARLKIPFGVGITGWVAAHRQVQRVNDITRDSRYISLNPKVRSEMAIPLLYRNEVLGVLNVESSKINAYSENDEEMLGTLAGSLAAIIAHSRLLEQYRQQVERERLLYEISNKIRRTSDPQKILTVAAEELNKAFNARRTDIVIRVSSLAKETGPDGQAKENHG